MCEDHSQKGKQASQIQATKGRASETQPEHTALQGVARGSCPLQFTTQGYSWSDVARSCPLFGWLSLHTCILETLTTQKSIPASTFRELQGPQAQRA